MLRSAPGARRPASDRLRRLTPRPAPRRSAICSATSSVRSVVALGRLDQRRVRLAARALPWASTRRRPAQLGERAQRDVRRDEGDVGEDEREDRDVGGHRSQARGAIASGPAGHGRIEAMGSLTAALIAFGVVLLVELPDKTLVASLVAVDPLPAASGARRRRARLRRAVRHRGRRRRRDHAAAARRAVEGGRRAAVRRRRRPAHPRVDGRRRRRRRAGRGARSQRRSGASSPRPSASCSPPSGATPARSRRPDWSPAGHGVAHAVATGVGAWVALVLVAALAVVVGKVVVTRCRCTSSTASPAVVFAVFAVLAAHRAPSG